MEFGIQWSFFLKRELTMGNRHTNKLIYMNAKLSIALCLWFWLSKFLLTAILMHGMFVGFLMNT